MLTFGEERKFQCSRGTGVSESSVVPVILVAVVAVFSEGTFQGKVFCSFRAPLTSGGTAISSLVSIFPPQMPFLFCW